MWKTGVKTVGMGNAAISAAQKLGLGIGQAAMGWILAAGKFDASLPSQPDSAKFAITFLYNWLPVILIVVCFFVMLFYKLDKEMPTVLKELEERRNK